MGEFNTYNDTEKQAIITQKEKAIKCMDSLMTEFINSSDKRVRKKASLLSYWLQDYARYLKWEIGFKPNKLKRYERGDIIQVNLGYNVGSEEGGLHYSIVIDNKNAKSSPVITVIPLSSYKPNSFIHRDDLFLGNELHEKMKIKHDTIFKATSIQKASLINELKKVDIEVKALNKLIKQSDLTPESKNMIEDLQTKNLIQVRQIRAEVDDLSADLELLKKIENEIKKMKQGSIALIGQITTISKLRIYDPKNPRSVLSGIKLSTEKLDELNSKIKKLYIYE